jgi:hypothetical protein
VHDAQLPGAEGCRVAIVAERRASPDHRELGLEARALRRNRQPVLAGAVGVGASNRRVDVKTLRGRRRTGAGHREQDPSFGHAQQRGGRQIHGGLLVDRERRPVRKEHLGAAARRADPVAGNDRHTRFGSHRLILAIERGLAFDGREMGGRRVGREILRIER